MNTCFDCGKPWGGMSARCDECKRARRRARDAELQECERRYRVSEIAKELIIAQYGRPNLSATTPSVGIVVAQAIIDAEVIERALDAYDRGPTS